MRYYRNTTYSVHVIVEYRDCSSIEGHGDVKRIRSQFPLNTIAIEQPELLYMHDKCVFVASVCMYEHIPKVYIHYFSSSPLVAYAFAAQFTHLYLRLPRLCI